MYIVLLLISVVYGPALAIVAVLGAAAGLSRRVRAVIRRHLIGD